MKKLLIVGLIFGVSFSVQAKVDKKDVEESVCRGMMDYAEMAMEFRQGGMPLSVGLNAIDKMKAEGKIPEFDLELARYSVVEAYKKPKFSIKENQQEAINEFAAEKYLNCLTHFAKK